MPTSVSELDAQVLPIERALIGAVLVTRGREIPGLAPSEFFLDRHQMIWAALIELADGVDLVSLYTQAVECGIAEAIGGAAYLAECFEEGVLACDLRGMARTIRAAATGRAIRRLGQEMLAQGLSQDEIEGRLAEMPGPIGGSEIDTIGDVWARIKAGWGHVRLLSTGLTALDEVSGGIVLGELLAVAGRTSHGKTSFLCHLGVELARQGQTVEIISLEEGIQAIVRRCIASRATVSYDRLRTGAVIEPEVTEADRAADWLEGLPLTVTTLTRLRDLSDDRVCGAVAASRASVVIVDHLQKIATAGDSRVYGLEAAMNRFHATAIRDGKAVILGVQVGRGVDDERREPRLSDIRDCGAVEIIARSVWLLYWPHRHDPKQPRDLYRIEIAKHSDGGTGKVEVRFQSHIASFENGE